MSKFGFNRLVPLTIRQSLRYRLLAFLLVSLLLLMGLTVVVVQRTASHEFEEILNGQMIMAGRGIFAVIVLELREGHIEEIPHLLNQFVRYRQGQGDWTGKSEEYDVYDNEFYFQLDDPDHETVFASMDTIVVERPATGLFMVETNGGQWHVFGLKDSLTEYTFYIGQSQILRHELSSESVEYILLPFALATLLILGSVWQGTRYGLKPLTRLRKELQDRSPDTLDPIDLDSKATELRPLVDSLNNLLLRVGGSLAAERRFSADASHELRTPLAGIKANLDAVRCVQGPSDQGKYLDNINQCVDNATRITEGLLLLSKLQSGNPRDYFECVLFNVDEVVREEVHRRISTQADWKSRVCVDAEPGRGSIAFNGPDGLLEIAVGNALENALKYSNGIVEVAVRQSHTGKITISVSDYGPGIRADKLNLICQRFYRVDTDTTTGFGLGLALVQQIMAVLGGSVEIGNRKPTGLNVILSLPLQAG